MSSKPRGRKDVPCPYCHGVAEFVHGDEIYEHRPDLHNKMFYICKPCDAYVGCHATSDAPLGRLADAELRKAKVAAHNAFDHLWKTGGMKRGDAYGLLARELGIPKKECHIGMFDVAMCNRVKSVMMGRKKLGRTPW